MAHLSGWPKARNSDFPKYLLDNRFGKTEITSRMEPARTIIKKLGGEAVVARVTGRASTAPYRWQYSKEKGGTGGNIPQRYHRALLEYAQQNKIDLAADELLPAEEPAQ